MKDIKQAIHELMHRSLNGRPGEKERVEAELGEIMLYIVRLANRLGINLAVAAEKSLHETINRGPKLVKPLPKGRDTSP